MLVLQRGFQQKIMIETSDGTLTVSVEGITGQSVKLGFEGPRSIRVWRQEVRVREAVPPRQTKE